MKKKPGPKRGPRLETILKQVRAMNLKPGESVIAHGLRITKMSNYLTVCKVRRPTSRGVIFVPDKED